MFHASHFVRCRLELCNVFSFRWPNLYITMIAFEACILFVYQPQRNMIALVDPHSHSNNRGAVIAAAKIWNVNNLLEWTAENIFFKKINKLASSYEMSLLFKNDSSTARYQWTN